MCSDLHIQVVNMINSSKEILKILGITVEDKVIIEGFSAGSKFASSFTALHPELIKAGVYGGTSGIGILPSEELDTPLGFKGRKNNIPLFNSIPQLYYIGEEDTNDAASYTMNNGTIEPLYDGCYTAREISYINSLLGTNNQERFKKISSIYQDNPNFSFKQVACGHVVDFNLVLDYINTHIKSPKKFENENNKII